MNKNQQLISRYLPKKNKARMNQMDTILLRVEQSCLGNQIVGKKSIKSSEFPMETGQSLHSSRRYPTFPWETGDETNEFVHVILSELTKYKLPIIVKIHDSDSYFVENELFALNQLVGFENSVTKLCDFSCLDDKSRWKHMVNAPVTFCDASTPLVPTHASPSKPIGLRPSGRESNHKQDKLHFIALEYIEHGELDTFFSKQHPNAVLCSLFLQMELAIMTLALDYRISHGDLNTGNILISATHKSRIHYRILGKEYRITSHGILPKLIDYGRCTKYVGNIHPSYVLDDIYTCLSVCAVHFKDTELKRRFQQFILNQSNSNHTDLHQILVQTKQFFD